MLAGVLCACGEDKPGGDTGGDSSQTTRPQVTAPSRPKKTEPEKTTPAPTAPQATTPSASQPDGQLTQRFTYEELTLYMPEEFGDMSQQAGLGIYDFVVGNDDAAICAARNDGVGYSYLDYAKLVASATDKSGQVTDHGGYATFSYQASGFGMDFQYTVGIFPSGDQMWIVQAYCQTKNVEQWDAALQAILASVEIDAGKTPDQPDQPDQQMRAYTYEEITVQVPAELKEDAATIAGTGFSFCLSSNSIVVVGLCEDVSSLGKDLTVEEYVDLMIQVNGLNATLEEHNGRTVFVYTAEVGVEFTYMGCSYKVGDEVWTVQAYTHSTAYDKYRDTLIEIVTSAKFE